MEARSGSRDGAVVLWKHVDGAMMCSRIVEARRGSRDGAVVFWKHVVGTVMVQWYCGSM